MTLAVIKTGGKQYKVEKGSVLKIEKIEGKDGDTLEFDALLKTDEKGGKIEIGTPIVESKVSGVIKAQGRANKVTVIKYKNKTRYKRTLGHKQHFTQVEITKI